MNRNHKFFILHFYLPSLSGASLWLTSRLRSVSLASSMLVSFFILTILMVGCKEFPNLFEGEKVLARAGKQTLRVMDVEEVCPVGISGADSVAWVESYVDRWVRNSLKLQEAARLFGDNAADEKLVEDFRNSLITRRLEQYFVNIAVGDSLLYTDRDLLNYYNRHRRDLVLDRTIVRGRVVAFPTAFRQKARLKELMAAEGSDGRAEFEAMVNKNGFTFREVAEWSEYSQFLALLPTRRNESYDNLLSRSGVQEMIDGGVTYWFTIDEARTPGASMPYEMAKERVRLEVSPRRKAEIVKAAEDSIYRVALHEKMAVINL